MPRIPNRDHTFYLTLRECHLTVSHGKGICLCDTAEKRHIDGLGGAAAVSIGHGIRETTEVMVKQAEKVSFAHSIPIVKTPSPVPSAWRCYLVSGSTRSFPGLPKGANIPCIGCKSSGAGGHW